MITKYYVDQNGVYLGGFSGALPPINSVEIPTPPTNGLDILTNGVWAAVPLTQADYMSKAQSIMDAQAQSMGYDNISTGISYAGDLFARFNAEGVALKTWRSLVWQSANATMTRVLAGEIAQPTLEEFELSLPGFTE